MAQNAEGKVPRLLRHPLAFWAASIVVGAGVAMVVTSILGPPADNGMAAGRDAPRSTLPPRASPSVAPSPSVPEWNGPSGDNLVTNPVPTPEPDAAQDAAIDRGGTFHVSMRGGFSVVAPDGWHAGTDGVRGERALNELAQSMDEPGLAEALDQLDTEEIDFAAFWAETDRGLSVPAAIRVERWSRYAGQPAEELAQLSVERSGASGVAQQSIALPAGEGTRLDWSYPAESGAPSEAVSYLLVTERWAYLLELRVEAAFATEAIPVFDEFARGFRSIPGPRRDFTTSSGEAGPVAIVLDAPVTLMPEELRAQQAAAIAIVESLGPIEDLAIIAGSDDPQVVVPLGAWQANRLDEVARIVADLRPRGRRDIAAGIDAALDAMEGYGGERKVIVFGLGDGGGSLVAGADRLAETLTSTFAIAVGTGSHERALYDLSSRTYGRFLQVSEAGELLDLAPSLFAAEHSRSSVMDVGEIDLLDGGGGETSVIVSADASHVRFDAGAAEGAVDLVVEDPTGRVVSTDTPAADARVIEGHRRTWISVADPVPGEWTISVRSESSTTASWSAIEQSQVAFYTFVAGEPETPEDLPIGWPVPIVVGLSHLGVDLDDFSVRDQWRVDGTVAMTRPDGAVLHSKLDDVGSSWMGFSTDIVLTPDALLGTGLPGSYRLDIDVRLVGPDDVEVRRAGARTVYYHPSPDADGDGFPDAVAELWGLDVDPASGPDSDLDNDGLTFAHEVLDHGTHPDRWDSDEGGESDGSEVNAGQDPLVATDDVPVESCVPADAERFEVSGADDAPKVPELEQLIPDEVGGETLEKDSIGGLPREFGFFNYYFDRLLICAGGTPDDMAVAYASVPSADGFVIFAIQVDTVTGAELERIHISEAIRAGAGTVSVEARAAAGREYQVLSEGGATASTGDVFYWMVQLSALDSGLYVAQDLDLALVEDVVRKLRAR